MRRGPTSESEPADWFCLADDRLRAADVLWKDAGCTFSGVELLQESVERHLKGCLIALGWNLVRTHDLTALVAEAAKHDDRFADFEDLAIVLTADFFAQHYPGSDLTNVGADYPSCRKETGRLIHLIRQLLPQYFPDSPTDSSA